MTRRPTAQPSGVAKLSDKTTRNDPGLATAQDRFDNEKRRDMQIEYTRRQGGGRSPVTDAATFRVGRVSRLAQRGTPADLSHLIDSSYDYHSPRELRWHLADRLGLAPAVVSLRESA